MRKGVVQKVIASWKLRYEHGDFKKIAVQTGYSRTTISNAFKGTATETVVTLISKYYYK